MDSHLRLKPGLLFGNSVQCLITISLNVFAAVYISVVELLLVRKHGGVSRTTLATEDPDEVDATGSFSVREVRLGCAG